VTVAPIYFGDYRPLENYVTGHQDIAAGISRSTDLSWMPAPISVTKGAKASMEISDPERDLYPEEQPYG